MSEAGRPTLRPLPSELMRFLDVWIAVQHGAHLVYRWSNRLDEAHTLAIVDAHRAFDIASPIRPQTTLQHVHGYEFLASYSCKLLRDRRVELDFELFMDACHMHDQGESELRRDKPAPLKTDADDLAEYQAVYQRLLQLPEVVFEAYHRAYLLQYAYAKPEWLTGQAREIVLELSRTHPVEAALFRVLEPWDYVLYAVEQFQRRGNAEILVKVLRRDLVAITTVGRHVPYFFEEILTQEIRTWCLDVLEVYRNHWLGSTCF